MAKSVRNDASTEAFSFGKAPLCLLVCLTSCLFGIGCNNGRQLQADLYQRELRLQEDKIYQLQDCVEEYQSLIRGYRMEVAELKSADRNSSKASSSLKSINKNSTRIEPLNGSSSRDSTSSDLEFRSPDELNSILDEAPEFEGNAPRFDPSVESLPMPDDAAEEVIDEAPLFIPQSYDDEIESPLVILSDNHIDVSASSKKQLSTDSPPLPNKLLQPLKSLDKGLILSAREEVGLELRNGSPESEGGATLLAKLHLFSESFDLANFQGELSFMLADRQTSGTPNRIARWDFSPREVQQAWKLQQNGSQSVQTLSPSKTIELPLLLPKRLPTDRTLEMWVRVVEPSGKKRITKIEADFLSNPLRLINAEPLAKTDEAPLESVTSSQWQRARADRFEPADSAVQHVTFESPILPAED